MRVEARPYAGVSDAVKCCQGGRCIQESVVEETNTNQIRHPSRRCVLEGQEKQKQERQENPEERWDVRRIPERHYFQIRKLWRDSAGLLTY